MFPEQLKKILQLIKQTGDRVIIFDSASPDDSYVITDINRYLEGQPEVKTLVSPKVEESQKKEENTTEKVESGNLTEEDLTDRINREISMWKNQDKAQSLDEEDKVKKSWQIPPAVKNKAHNIE